MDDFWVCRFKCLIACALRPVRPSVRNKNMLGIGGNAVFVG